MKNKNFPVKEKETFLKLHSTTEVEDHKVASSTKTWPVLSGLIQMA